MKIFRNIALGLALTVAGSAAFAQNDDVVLPEPEKVDVEELKAFAEDAKLNFSLSVGSDLDFDDMQVPVRVSMGSEALPLGLGVRADLDVNHGGEWFDGTGVAGMLYKDLSLGPIGTYFGPRYGYSFASEESAVGAGLGVEFAVGGVGTFVEANADYEYQVYNDFDFEDVHTHVHLGVKKQF